MKISVLIPTHNRPKLFERCIQSVFSAFKFFPVELEILVNNDSNDIVEQSFDGINIRYFYHRDTNISTIYKKLFCESGGEYVYFLEDDDIMAETFFQVLSEFDEDILYFNYVPYKITKNFIDFFKYTNNQFSSKEDFLLNYDDFNFQFGQICFRKKCLNLDEFPSDNYIKNDFLIFKSIKGTFKNIDKYLYRQTIDGGDNISFKDLNKDYRWNRK